MLGCKYGALLVFLSLLVPPVGVEPDLSLSNQDLEAPKAHSASAEPPQAVTVRIVPDGRTGVDGNFALLVKADEELDLELEIVPDALPPSSPLPSVAAQAGHPGRVTQDEQTRSEWEWTSGRAQALSTGGIRWRAGRDGRLAEVRVRYSSRKAMTTESATEVLDGSAAGVLEGNAELRLLPGLRFDRNGDGVLEGTVIGIYPNEYDDRAPSVVRRNSALYHPPSTFYRLDGTTRHLNLSDHVRLGFLNPPVFAEEEARYVALDPNLAPFWEELRRQVELGGRSAVGLRILRGFLSPHERQRLERMGVKLAEFTRYQYGDALAVIYDRNNDFRMDDLNQDGEVTIQDAEVLAGWVDQALRALELKGGIGISASFEGPNHIGTPYVHADLRGWWERWEER